MIDFSHLLDFATQLPHPSDIGLVKPSGGFNISAALCGLGAVFGASQFFYYSELAVKVFISSTFSFGSLIKNVSCSYLVPLNLKYGSS